MRVLTMFRPCLIGAIVLGLFAALTAGTPQAVTDGSTSIGGACPDCSGDIWKKCSSWQSECSETTTIQRCLPDPVVTRYCHVTEAEADDCVNASGTTDCTVRPDKQDCKDDAPE